MRSHRIFIYYEIDIVWCDEISPVAKDLISKLLNSNPEERLGSNGAAEIKAHPFFQGINWDTILTEKPPFIPKLEDPESIAYFQRKNSLISCTNILVARDLRFPLKDIELIKELEDTNAIGILIK